MTDEPGSPDPASPRLRDLIIERVSHIVVGAALVFAVDHGLAGKTEAAQLSGWLDAVVIALIGAGWARLSAGHALASWLAALNATPPSLDPCLAPLIRASAAREADGAAAASPAAVSSAIPPLGPSAAAQEMIPMTDTPAETAPSAQTSAQAGPLAQIESRISGLWKKFVSWFDGVALPALQNDEKQLVALFEPILNAGEAAALQDLKVAITGILTQVETGKYDLPTLEGVVLSALQTVGAELYDLAKSMGSNALQSLIGLILAKMAVAAVKAA